LHLLEYILMILSPSFGLNILAFNLITFTLKEKNL